MGMPVVFDIRDPAGDDAIDDAMRWLVRVDELFSTYKDDSEINRIERGELSVGDADALVREVLARCAELRTKTNGYFDANARGPLDPSGLVKGWAVDHAVVILEAAGLRNFAINAGGDMCVRGREWRVGIQHPQERDKLCRVIEITDVALATSGAYIRGTHVVDPHTEQAPEGVLSVSILGPDLATADAYATAAFAMGTAGPAWTSRLQGYEAMTVLADGRVLVTPGFPPAARPDHKDAGSVALSSTQPTGP
jgi:thiamine biosynthesis lipoprotein